MRKQMSCAAWVKEYIQSEVGNPLAWSGYLKVLISELEHEFIQVYHRKQRLLERYTDEDYNTLYGLGLDPIQDLDDELKSIQIHIEHLNAYIDVTRTFKSILSDIEATCDIYVAEEKK